MDEKKDIIFCDGLVKIYKTKEIEVMALSGLELAIAQGEMMAVIGKAEAVNLPFSTWLAD